MKPALPFVVLLAFVALLAFVLSACSGPRTGPEDIHYDRDQCEQCRMIISDPHFAAEVRGTDGKLHKFDDLGGAILWMKANAVEASKSEVWVMSMRDGKTWLDAHKAYYISDQTTPMDFGYGAIAQNEAGAIDFEALTTTVLALPTMRMDMGQ